MAGSASRTLRAEPNLTPILDMVFQLITFFMLVISFKSEEIDLTLKLPVVGSACPVKTKGQEQFLVLNINNKGQLSTFGTLRQAEQIDEYIAREAQVTRLALRSSQPNLQPGDELPTTVVIRGDKSTPFRLLFHVIRVCQENGFRKYALKAWSKEDIR